MEAKERFPVTANILMELCILLKSQILEKFTSLMLLSAFTMAFAGFLRCGEFTVKNASERKNILRIKNVCIDKNLEFYQLLLPTSKCDPFHKGVKITIFENNFQAVRLMRQYIDIRIQSGASEDSPLFIENELSLNPLSRDRFIYFLKELLTKLGYDENKFSGHSFRIGAATSAAANGVQDHLIQALGRWSSDCYIRYIKTDLNSIKTAQQEMCTYSTI